MSKVNLVMIADNNYVKPTVVALTSIFCNKQPETCYDIKILVNNLDDHAVQLLNSLNRKDFNVSILDKSDLCSQFKMVNKERHVSYTAVLKFFIPDIFTNLDKILYIDSDVIVNTDLSTHICDKL